MELKTIKTIDIYRSQKNIDLYIHLFEDIEWDYEAPLSYKELALYLKDRQPYILTVLMLPLDAELWNNKKYVEVKKIPIQTKYMELLNKELEKDFGGWSAVNEYYATLLDKYRGHLSPEQDIDEYILKYEIEPKYKESILKKHKNTKELFRKRFRIVRKRYFAAPPPFDTLGDRALNYHIFVWKKDKKKYARIGYSTSSGAREVTSRFGYALMSLRKEMPIPTYIFIYNKENNLMFIDKINEPCLQYIDYGSNYSIPYEEHTAMLQGGKCMQFNWQELFDGDSGKIKIETVI